MQLYYGFTVDYGGGRMTFFSTGLVPHREITESVVLATREGYHGA